MFEPDELLRTQTGRGHVSADGAALVRVAYRILIERRGGVLRAHGTLSGNAAALRVIWLIPDAVLRLKDGSAIDISITDLLDGMAEFESTGLVLLR